MGLTREQIESIAALARLELRRRRFPSTRRACRAFIDFVGALERVDTADVTPMAHPLPGLSQRLRPDVVTEQDHHEEYQRERAADRRGPVPRSQGDRVRPGMSELHP